MTEFRVRGNQVQAGMQQMVGGTANWTRSIGDATRQSEKLSNLWKSMATTFRYAVAGQVVFGLARMVTQLKDIQVQMGLISAIGTVQGSGGQSIPLTGNNLKKLQNDILKGSIQSMTPVQDYTNAVINLLSTIQDIPQDQITPIVTTIAQAAKLAQINAEDATQAFTTLSVAFGKKPTSASIQRAAQEFFILTKEAPGGVAAGQQIVQQMGTLASVTRAAHGTPEDMFTLLLSGLRGGIPPAQTSRALSFFLQTLAFPANQTKSSRNALASIGITGTSQLPAMEMVNRVLKRAGALGIHGDITKMNFSDEDISNFESMPDDQGSQAALTKAGVTGPGAVFLGTVFHRIHALRIALALSTQAEMGQLQKDVKTYQDAGKGIVSQADDLAQATKRFQDQAPLQKAAIALDSLRVQVEQAIIAPFANPISRVLTAASSAAVGHPKETTAALWTALGLGAVVGGKRFFRGLGGRAVPAIAAAESLATGNNQLGTLTNPMFVIIVGDMGRIFNPGNNRIPTPYGPVEKPGGRLPGDPAPKTPPRGRLGRLGRIGATVGAGALTWEAAVMVGAAYEAHGFEQSILSKDDPTRQYSGAQGWGELYRDVKKRFGGSGLDYAKSAWHSIFGGGDHPARTAAVRTAMARDSRQFAFGHPRSDDPDIGLGGYKKNELTLNLNVKHPDGTTQKKKVHLPITQYQNGKHPTQGGQVKARR